LYWQEDKLLISERRLDGRMFLEEKKEVEPRAQAVLYTRPGCDLCEEMKEAMRGSGCVGLYSLEEVDIETEPELFARYQFEIPVLCINGVEAFRHHLRPDEFKAYVIALAAESDQPSD